MNTPESIVDTCRLGQIAGRRIAPNWLAALWLALGLGYAQPTAAQQRVPIDYVFLVDVSASMVGQGGTPNIFGDVKSAINSFLGQLDAGSQVFIAPFAGRIQAIRRFPIGGPADVASAQNYVSGLVADGQSTGIYRSMDEVLRWLEQNRPSVRGERITVFFVYTDGNDNVSPGWTLRRFLQDFALKRDRRDWLFYTELGLPPDPAKAQVFRGFDQTIYVPEAKGTVHPIVQVEVLLPRLHFGNLKTRPNAERAQKFVTRGMQHVSSPVSIRTEIAFPQLAQQGVLAQVNPESFPIADSVPLRIQLTNREALADGEYTGILRFRATDPLVLVVPSEIEIVFAFGADQQVTILPGVGTSFPISFGKVQPHGRPPVLSEKGIQLQFTSTAAAAGTGLRFHLEENPNNPQPLAQRLGLASGRDTGASGLISPRNTAANLLVRIDSTLPPGRYAGKVRFVEDGLTIVGAGLLDDPAGGKYVEWELEIGRKPIPAWVWIGLLILVLLAGGLVARRFMKPPTFVDLKLEVLEPERRQIDLAGKERIAAGQGREAFPESATAFTIIAKKRGGRPGALLELEEGTILVKKQGSRDEVHVIGDEEVFDGDILHFGEYRVRVSSFSIVRD